MCVCVRAVPCSTSRRTTNMNSIVYNKYPIMIAPTGNMPQPPTVKIHKQIHIVHIHTYIRRTNWINYENHENWVNSFWLNNCPAFVGHRTWRCISLFFFFVHFTPPIWQAWHVLRAPNAPWQHGTCCNAACHMQLQCVNKNKRVSRGDQLPFNVIILIHFTIYPDTPPHPPHQSHAPCGIPLQFPIFARPWVLLHVSHSLLNLRIHILIFI